MRDDQTSSRRADPDETLIAAATVSSTVAVGGQIGPYKLVREVGRGGMGVVFLAEQEEPLRRQVALKLIHSDLASVEVIRRFEAERQALALMDHPNIAKVFDAGTSAEGIPYYVMEYVEGLPITTYCDRNSLSISGRLSLFLQACAAVHHAHEKGVLHRDIKPSNVLVTESDSSPQVRVIDFGLAKASQPGTRLAGTTLLTGVGQLLGTVQYMSPEQAELDPAAVDARSDEYSLGVLLYELLVGSTPIERERIRALSLTRLIVAIREEEHDSPSRRLMRQEISASQIASMRSTSARHLGTILREDLDWPVLRATDKDRNQRYPSVAHLADDVRRFLNGEPLEARPPSLLYRLLRVTTHSLKAHPTYWLAGVVVLILLQFVVVNLIGFAYPAEAEKLLALRGLVAKSAAVGGILGLLYASIGRLWHEDPIEKTLLRSVAFWSLGTTIVMLSLERANPVRTLVEQLRQPVIHLDAVSDSGRPASAGTVPKPNPVASEIAALRELARASQRSGDFLQAEELYRQIIELQKVAQGMRHPDYARTLKDLAGVYLETGELSRARTLLRHAEEILEASESPGE